MACKNRPLALFTECRSSGSRGSLDGSLVVGGGCQWDKGEVGSGQGIWR